MNNLQPSFRFAQRKDTGLILAFIKSLAEYEKMAGNVIATEELLEEWILTRERPKCCLSWRTAFPSVSPFSSITSLPSSEEPESISRISLFSRNIGEKAMEKQF